MKFYMFRTVRLSIIRNLFTVHSAGFYVIYVCIQVSSRTRSRSKAFYKPVWHMPLLSVQWINSWWWIEELSETCRVSCQNKFVKLVHLVGFITKKFTAQCQLVWLCEWRTQLHNCVYPLYSINHITCCTLITKSVTTLVASNENMSQ
jgi:hypothetical protein